VDGKSVVNPPVWRLWRSLYPTGRLVSSACDLLRYARFHLSDGADIEGSPVLSAASLRAMRTQLGPGGTDGCEIDGVGVNWFQRRTAEGVPVYHWPGSWAGQYASLMFEPDRGFAFTLLTNGPSGLRDDFLDGDWVIEHFVGLHNPPAAPQTLTAAQLAPYEGRYTGQVIDPPPGVSGETVEISFVLRAADGGLRMRFLDDVNQELDPGPENTASEIGLAFYRDNYVVLLDDAGNPTATRADFVPGATGDIAWFSFIGNLYRHMD
jgi:hypothetical protein